MYFTNDVAEALAGDAAGKSGKKTAQPRLLKLSPSFSSVHDLMPGRKPFTKGKKRSIARHKSKDRSEAA
jgi:hypothetical protein